MMNSSSKISEQTKPNKILQIFLISTEASARCGWGWGMFQPFQRLLREQGKRLKRLVPALVSRHRAKATVLMRISLCRPVNDSGRLPATAWGVSSNSANGVFERSAAL
jgi:hypothetical protein